MGMFITLEGSSLLASIPEVAPRTVTTSRGQMEQLHLAQRHGKDGEKLMAEQIGRRQ